MGLAHDRFSVNVSSLFRSFCDLPTLQKPARCLCAVKTPVVWTVAVLTESGSVLPVVPRISANSDFVKMFEVPTVLEAFCFCRDGSGIQRNKKTSSFIVAVPCSCQQYPSSIPGE